MNTSELTKDQKSMLTYIETCVVDHGGTLEAARMNAADHEAMKDLKSLKLIDHGRMPSEFLRVHGARKCAHWAVLTDAGWEVAHKLRRERAERAIKGAYVNMYEAISERRGEKVPA